MQVDRFMRYVRAVADPLSILDDLRDGTVTQEGAEAVRTVYPELFQDLADTILTELEGREEPLPYEERIRLGILLGAPTDPTLEPAFVAELQGHLAAAGAEAEAHEAEQAALLSPNRRSAPEMAEDRQTGVERLLRAS
jgi:hypothetical protein